LDTSAIPPIVTAFSGARDQYQVPIAFAEAGLLHRFFTDAYFPADQAWFKATVGRLLGPRVQKRFRNALPSHLVSMPAMAAWHGLLGKENNPFKDAALSRAARRIARREQATLLLYSYYAAEAFAEGPDRPAKRLLFQLHPHPASVRRLLQEEAERAPVTRTSLMQESEMKLPQPLYERLCSEAALANGWIAASSFTARTLAENGVPYQQVRVVPYGVDLSRFPLRQKPPQGPFTVIFLGQITGRKGLYDLFEAMRLLKSKNIRLILCGRGIHDQPLLDAYKDIDMDVRLNLTHEAYIQAIHEADVFVLPSLVEGFGLVILEAMACGLPIIASHNTAAPEIITEGQEGFIMPIRAPQKLAEQITWCLEHRPDLPAMGQQAAAKAATFTWPKFRTGMVDAYRQILAKMDTGHS
jgi:glycosyltransferase involved in cell wall biosynthesis